MPTLIKDTSIVDDEWQLLDKDIEPDNSVLLSNHPMIMPLSAWLAHRERILQDVDALAHTGVWIDSDESPHALAEDCEKLSLIAINFPVFADGRGYSYATILRNTYDYKGELRAIGDVLVDQMHFYRRVGFDAYAVRDDIDADTALKGLDDFSVHYQAAEDNHTPLFRRRH